MKTNKIECLLSFYRKSLADRMRQCTVGLFFFSLCESIRKKCWQKCCHNSELVRCILKLACNNIESWQICVEMNMHSLDILCVYLPQPLRFCMLWRKTDDLLLQTNIWMSHLLTSEYRAVSLSNFFHFPVVSLRFLNNVDNFFCKHTFSLSIFCTVTCNKLIH